MATAVREQSRNYQQPVQLASSQETKGRELLEASAVSDKYLSHYADKDICRSFNGKTKFDSKVGLSSEVT